MNDTNRNLMKGAVADATFAGRVVLSDTRVYASGVGGEGVG